MGTAISLFVLLSISVFVVRVAAVTLRITGLSDSSARFQALSAFTGTGFTTGESETIVNYPIRRRVVSLLMIIGNMGLVTALATLAASFVQTNGDFSAVVIQVAWLLGGLTLLWVFMLSPAADRFLCGAIASALDSTTFLGARKYQRLVQIGNGYSVCEHPATRFLIDENERLKTNSIDDLQLIVLGIRLKDGKYVTTNLPNIQLQNGIGIVLSGPDQGHDELELKAKFLDN